MHAGTLDLPSLLHEPESLPPRSELDRQTGQGWLGTAARGDQLELRTGPEPGQAGARKTPQRETPDLEGGMRLLYESWTLY